MSRKEEVSSDLDPLSLLGAEEEAKKKKEEEKELQQQDRLRGHSFVGEQKKNSQDKLSSFNTVLPKVSPFLFVSSPSSFEWEGVMFLFFF